MVPVTGRFIGLFTVSIPPTTATLSIPESSSCTLPLMRTSPFTLGASAVTIVVISEGTVKSISGSVVSM